MSVYVYVENTPHPDCTPSNKIYLPSPGSWSYSKILFGPLGVAEPDIFDDELDFNRGSVVAESKVNRFFPMESFENVLDIALFSSFDGVISPGASLRHNSSLFGASTSSVYDLMSTHLSTSGVKAGTPTPHSISPYVGFNVDLMIG